MNHIGVNHKYATLEHNGEIKMRKDFRRSLSRNNFLGVKKDELKKRTNLYIACMTVSMQNKKHDH